MWSIRRYLETLGLHSMNNISTLNYKGLSHIDARLKYKPVQFDDLGKLKPGLLLEVLQ